MKHRSTALALLLAASALAPGCKSTGSGAATGAAVGGLLGAGGGYAIGHHRGNRTNWALALGAGGALVGYLLGDVWDENRAAENAGPPTPTPVVGYQAFPSERVIVRERYVGPCDDPAAPPGW